EVRHRPDEPALACLLLLARLHVLARVVEPVVGNVVDALAGLGGGAAERGAVEQRQGQLSGLGGGAPGARALRRGVEGPPPGRGGRSAPPWRTPSRGRGAWRLRGRRRACRRRAPPRTPGRRRAAPCSRRRRGPPLVGCPSWADPTTRATPNSRSPRSAGRRRP